MNTNAAAAAGAVAVSLTAAAAAVSASSDPYLAFDGATALDDLLRSCPEMFPLC